MLSFMILATYKNSNYSIVIASNEFYLSNFTCVVVSDASTAL